MPTSMWDTLWNFSTLCFSQLGKPLPTSQLKRLDSQLGSRWIVWVQTDLLVIPLSRRWGQPRLIQQWTLLKKLLLYPWHAFPSPELVTCFPQPTLPWFIRVVPLLSSVHVSCLNARLIPIHPAVPLCMTVVADPKLDSQPVRMYRERLGEKQLKKNYLAGR